MVYRGRLEDSPRNSEGQVIVSASPRHQRYNSVHHVHCNFGLLSLGLLQHGDVGALLRQPDSAQQVGVPGVGPEVVQFGSSAMPRIVTRRVSLAR